MERTSPETETLRAALETIAGWRKVNIQGEYEHGLRDIIRSITDCATTALDAAGHAQRPIRNDMRALFRNVDDDDWNWLLSHLNDGGRARFWKTVIADVRGALSFSSTDGEGK